MQQTYPFSMEPLPYSYNALEPYIDQKVVEIHYTRHLKSYIDNLNSTLSGYPDLYNWTIEDLLTKLECIPSSIQESVKQNAGGVYNHVLYFHSMTEPKQSILSNRFATVIKKDFGSIEWFKNIFRTTAQKVFGSGYAWLVLTPSKNLAVVMTKNQDTPLPAGLMPLLNIDVWEHAYYLQYLNLRTDYINAWFHIINWSNMEMLYMNAMSKKRCNTSD